ncbi:MAG TPA: hypothetical protein VFU59_08480, partial [Candidatus Eisenbacteria bacterium]|nr:hypothetical protein [Candidatus Eisenbacteria bacterium]
MSRAPRAALALLLAAAALAPSPARAATRLFIVNHVASNDVRAAAPWGAALALATNGGLVFADTATGATSKVLRQGGGIASNNLLSIVASPAGYLWIGTADRGLARYRPDGTFPRTLTSFDGLGTDRVQALLRTGDSIWVATSGGVALFVENPANGQISLRRSDSSASTGGALVSDDVTSFAVWNDTLWCGTNSGLSVFAAGAWSARKNLVSERVQALLVARDSLWIGTKTGLRVYAGGAVASRGLAAETLALASVPDGVGRGTVLGPFVETPGGAEVSLGVIGLPIVRVQMLATTAASRVVAGTAAGLARRVNGPVPWDPVRSNGPEWNGGSRAAAGGGNLWITLGNAAPPGLSIGTLLRYDGAAWSAISNTSSGGNLQTTGAIGVLAAGDGRVWTGHCCSGALGSSRPRIDRWDPSADLWDTPPAYNVYALAQGSTGRVFAAGVEYENGVYLLDGITGAMEDSLTPANTNAGLTRNNLRGVAVDPSGRAWIATVDNGVDRWNGNGTLDHADDVWTHFSGNGFPTLQTTSIAAISTNEVWVGTRGGAVRILNDAIDIATSANVNAAIAGAAVNDLAADGEGGVWIATAGGLTRVSSTGVLESFGEADGLAASDVAALAWDGAREILWAVTAGGVSEIHVSRTTRASFDDGSYVYPNPATATSGSIRLGG